MQYYNTHNIAMVQAGTRQENKKTRKAALNLFPSLTKKKKKFCILK
jgi:hypothetical protein